MGDTHRGTGGQGLTAVEKAREPTPRSKLPRPICCNVSSVAESQMCTMGCSGCGDSAGRGSRGVPSHGGGDIYPHPILSLSPSCPCRRPVFLPSYSHPVPISVSVPSPSSSHPHLCPIPILIPSPSPSHPHPLPITMSVPSPSSFHPRLSPNLILVPSLSPSCSHPHSDPIPEPIPIPSHSITFPSLSTPAACPVATRRRSGCTARLRGEAGGKGGVVEWRQGTSPPHPGLTSARSRCGAGSGAGGGAGRAGG